MKKATPKQVEMLTVEMMEDIINDFEEETENCENERDWDIHDWDREDGKMGYEMEYYPADEVPYSVRIMYKAGTKANTFYETLLVIETSTITELKTELSKVVNMTYKAD